MTLDGAPSWARLAGPLAGVCGLAWALLDPSWRDAHGALTTGVMWPVAIAVALSVIGLTHGSRLARAAWWASLALVGQVAALHLIDAGHLLRYQHYPPLAELIGTRTGPLGFIALQAVLVMAAFARWGRHAVRGFVPLSLPRIVIVLALATVTAATVSPDPLRYATELAFAIVIQLLNLATVLLAVLAVPAEVLPRVRRAIDRVVGADAADPEAGGPPRRDRVGLAAGLLAVVVSATLSVLAYERHPHVPDEVVYVLHARYFSAGMLTMPAPPVPEAFDLDLMTYEADRWFSPVPPGWPAVLALGTAVGAPWLVNPLLAGLSVWLAYLLLCELYTRRVARWGTLLLACSPWFLFLGMSYMTHMLALACALLAAVGVARARRTGSLAWSLAGGCGVGITSLIRPLDGLLIGILIALWAIGIGGRRLRLPALATLLLGTVVTGAIAFPYNRELTGDPLRFPINAYIDQVYGPNANAYGFGSDRGLGWAIDPNPGHGPIDGLININLNTFGINTDLFGWSTGSLVFVALFLVAGRYSRSDRVMLAAIFVIVTGYFFYYFSGGPDFAARYWFPVIVPLTVLTARGILLLEQGAGARAALAVALLVSMALVNYVPWRAMDKYRSFRGMRGGVAQLAAAHGIDGDLVLVRGHRFPDYASAAVENPADLTSAATVYAWDRSADVREKVLRAYPDRRVWILEGPSITGAGYRLAAGPLAASELPAFAGVAE